MIEVSTVLFSLLVEGFVALLIVISVSLFLLYKRKNKDTGAVKKLVDQIKQQSKIRLEKTGSFLSEKYRFEGNELEKAVKAIDKAEKKFMQKMINVYLKRDTHGLISMDACVAELIETYKELSPVMPDAEMLAEMAAEINDQSEGLTEEIENLKELNEKLTNELGITKETMGNMIAEFGNMFGGGKEHELESDAVIDKVKETTGDTAEIAHVGAEAETEQSTEVSKEQDEVEEVNETESVDDIQLDETGSDDLDMDDLSEHEDLMDHLIDEDVGLDDMEIVKPEEVEKIEESKKEEPKKPEPKKDEIFDEGIEDLIDGIDLSDDSL